MSSITEEQYTYEYVLNPDGTVAALAATTVNAYGSQTEDKGNTFLVTSAKDFNGEYVYQGTGTITTSTTTYSGITATYNGLTFFITDQKIPHAEYANGKMPTPVVTDPNGTTTFCFMAGTAIATPAGEAAIETLSIGDLVVTSEGKTAPIRWMGVQTVASRFADRLHTLPVRVKANAFAENMPKRDLLMSPDHALFVDGILVHAGALVNGTSIVREETVPATFKYFHIELHDHALVLAENLPAETFIDNADRRNFDNWDEHEALYGDGAELSELDLPRAKSSRQVPAALRAHLEARGLELYAETVATAA